MELTKPMFLRIRNEIMGMITVNIKIGRILALSNSGGLNRGVIKK